MHKSFVIDEYKHKMIKVCFSKNIDLSTSL